MLAGTLHAGENRPGESTFELQCEINQILPRCEWDGSNFSYPPLTPREFSIPFPFEHDDNVYEDASIFQENLGGVNGRYWKHGNRHSILLQILERSLKPGHQQHIPAGSNNPQWSEQVSRPHVKPAQIRCNDVKLLYCVGNGGISARVRSAFPAHRLRISLPIASPCCSEVMLVQGHACACLRIPAWRRQGETHAREIHLSPYHVLYQHSYLHAHSRTPPEPVRYSAGYLMLLS